MTITTTARSICTAPWRLLRRRYSINAVCHAAVQALGCAIIFAAIFTPQAWRQFTLEFLEPNMIWVMWNLLAPPHSGAAVFSDIFALAGAVGAAIVAIPVAVATFAAAPGDNEPSPQKAATLICLSAFLYFWVALARWRFPLFNVVGRLTLIGSALALVPSYWASVSGMSRHDIAYIFCYVLIVIAVGLLVTFLLIPLPTADFARRATVEALSLVAQVQRQAAEMFGTADTAEAALPPETASQLYDLDSQATKKLRAASLLNKLTAFDFAVYWKPHRHPHSAYVRLLKLAVRVERLTLAAAITLLEGECSSSSEGPLGSLPQLQALMTAEADAIAAASAALSGEATLESVFEASADVSKASTALLDATLAATGKDNAVALLDAISDKGLKGTGAHFESLELVVMAASRIRSLCEEALPPAVGRPASAGPPPATPALPKIAPTGPLLSQNESVIELAPQGPWWRLTWRRVATATGIRPWHVALALQLTIVYISAALLATNTASYEALGRETQWIFITIFVITDLTAGAVAVAGVDRIAGCAVGCIFSSAVVGLALAINGGSYDNTAGKLVTIGVCLSLWAGWCRAERIHAAPKSEKFWSQATMVPMVCVVNQATNAPWQLLGYRMANVAVGVALQLAVSGLIFPVTTLGHSRTLVAAALQKAAAATDATFEVLGMAEDGESENGTEKASDVENGAVGEDADHAQALAAAEERLEAASAAAQEHLDQLVLLRRDAPTFWHVIRKAGPEHEALARALQVYLTNLSTCVAERNLLSRAGAWRLDAGAQQRCAAAGAQLAAALRALELVVTSYASVNAALGIKEAVLRISGELEAAAAPADTPPSKAQLVAPAVISRSFGRVVRQMEVVYDAAVAAFEFKKPTAES